MKAMRKILYRIHDQRGASAVEFAIILPLLVVFVFGIIEFSIMFYDKAVITNASREGARRGIVWGDPRPDPSEIQSAVENYSQDRLITFGTPNLKTETVSSSADDPTRCVDSADELTVTVTYTYNYLIVPDILGAFFVEEPFTDGATSIIAITKMRCE